MSSRLLGKCGCNCGEADIQMAIAVLRRVGFGPFTFNGSGSADLHGAMPDFTGPLGDSPQKWIDPLYVHLTTLMAWADPASTSYGSDIVIDPDYADVIVSAYSSSVPLPARIAPQTHVPITADFLNNDFNFVNYGDYPPDAPANVSYGWKLGEAPLGAVSADAGVPGCGLSFTMQWPTTYDRDGSGNIIHTYYGGTLTWSLHADSKQTLADYAAICSGFLDAVTLQDGTLAPDKIYPAIKADGSPYPTKLRYFCEMPRYYDALADLTEFSNFLYVGQRRGSGIIFGRDIEAVLPPGLRPIVDPGWGSWQMAGPPCIMKLNYWDTNAILPPIGYRYPLAAHGMVFTHVQDPAFGVPMGMVPGAPALTDAAFIFSVKSSVKSGVNLAASAVAMIYNPLADSLSAETPALPAGNGEYLFAPSDVGGLGFLAARFEPDALCTPVLAPLPDFVPVWTPPLIPFGPPSVIFLNRGESRTFFAATFDKTGNFLRNAAGKWSLQEGGAGFGTVSQANIVPSADGLNAVFTAPSAAGEAFIRVDIAGCQFVPGLVVVVT